MYGTRTSHLRLGILCVLVYVAASWLVRFDMRRGEQIASIVYPFDTFSMYARLPSGFVGHLVLIDEQGDEHRVRTFASFDCTWQDPGAASACFDHSIRYHDDDLTHFIEEHTGSGETPVRLVRRSWQLHEDRAPEFLEDCELARCLVAPP